MKFHWNSPFALSTAVLIAFCSMSAPVEAATFEYEELLDGSRNENSEFPFEGIEDAALRREVGEVLALIVYERFEEAFAAATRMTNARPDMPQGWHLLGIAQANLEKFDEALASWERAGALYEFNSDPWVMSGDLLLALRRLDEARTAYETALQRNPEEWRALEALSRIALVSGDNEAALRYVSKAISSAPAEEFELHKRLAAVNELLGKPADGLEVLRQYAEAHPDHLEAHRVLGRTAFEMGEVEIALGALGRAVDLLQQPDADLSMLLARVQMASGDFPAAEQTLTSAAAALTGQAELNLMLGNVLGAQRKYEDARQVYARQLEATPNDIRFQRAMSQVMIRLDQREAALDLARAVASTSEAGADDHFWLGWLLESAGSRDEAVAAYEAALVESPEHLLSLNNLAALVAESDPARAVALAERAVAAGPEVPALIDTLGWSHFLAGQYEEAEAAFLDLIDRQPENATAHFRLGKVLVARGQTDKGMDEFRRALDLDPDFRYANEARAALGLPAE